MKPRSLIPHMLVIILILVFTSSAAPGQAQETGQQGTLESQAIGTVFTYQGQLKKDGSSMNATCDFLFTLYDAESGGSQVGPSQAKTGINLTNGLFAVNLDFGAGVFTGNPRWLAIAVKCAGDAAYVPLAGRQLLTPAPYALYAAAAGSVPWSGLTSVPAGFADNVDDSTTYSAGVGLTLAGTEFTADTAYLQRRASGACAVGSTIRAINADGSLVCQADANTTYSAGVGLTLAGTEFTADTAYLQRRASGACAVGSTIRAINADGTVVCQPLGNPERAYPPASNTTLTPVVGRMDFYTAATIGSDARGLILYSDSASLSVAHCNDVSCSSTSLYTLRDNGDDGGFPSIAIGSDGLGLISFYYWSGVRLEVGHCNNPECSSATFTTLDSKPEVGWYSAITIAGDGKGLISYYDHSSGDLRVAHCNDLACTGAITTTLDVTGTAGLYTSIVTGLDGFGLISYYDQYNGDLRVAHCENYTCSTAVLSTLDSTGDVGLYTSVTIGQDGLGLISYYDQSNGSLKVAHCNNLACSTADSIGLDGFGSADVGRYTGITVGLDGLPRVVYYDVTNNDFRFALCRGPDCQSGAVTYVLDQNARSSGWSTRPAITIGVDGNPLISYHDCYSDPRGDLKIIHCATPYCASYFQRR